MTMKVIAVIPAYKEATRIERVIRSLQPHVDQVVVVDDGSPDETFQKAQQAGALTLRHSINRGQGAALKTATMAALRLGADVIVHFDADGQHQPESIPQFLKELQQGNDIVLGSRFLGVNSVGMPVSKQWILRIAGQVNRLLFGISPRITDPQNGFRVMTSRAASVLDFKQDRFAHCSEILRLVSHSSLTWKELPTQVTYTADTIAKGVRFKQGIEIIWQLFLGYFH